MDEVISQEENKPSRFAKYRKKRFLLFIFFLTPLVILAVFIGLKLIQHQNQVKLAKRGVFINKSLDGKPLLNIEKNINTPILLPYVPNFDNLDEFDLPIGNGTLIPYRNHYITWWWYQILEIDAKTHKYIREAKMPCSVDDLIVHNSTLFVLCSPKIISSSPNLSSVYTIDLNSGMLKDHISPVDISHTVDSTDLEQYPYLNILNHTSDLNFTFEGDNLWLGVKNGVVKINTSNNDTTFYNLNAFTCKYTCLKFEDYSTDDGQFLVYSNKSSVWTYTETPDKKIILYVYNNKKDSWDNYSSDSIEKSIPINNVNFMFSGNDDILMYYTIPGSNRINSVNTSSFQYRFIIFDTITKKWRHLTDSGNVSEVQEKYFPGTDKYRVPDTRFGPYFQIISNKVNGKYYLLGNDGIYVLKKNTFPKKILDLDLEKIEGKLYKNGIYGTMYVNKDETYILIMGRKGYPEYGDNTVGKQVAILRIDLNSKKIIDIMKNSAVSQQNMPINGYLQQVMDLFLSNLKLLPTKDGITITGNLNPKSSTDIRQVGEINLQNNTFKLFYSCQNLHSSQIEDCFPKE
jgi:hypothetical protein